MTVSKSSIWLPSISRPYISYTKMSSTEVAKSRQSSSKSNNFEKLVSSIVIIIIHKY